MKMVKSLLLGSAAGIVALSGAAQAADLPVKAKPVEYVKVCSIYGAGFYYIPGTDTCVKVGGFVRAEWAYNAGGSHSVFLSGANARDTRESDRYGTRVRGIVSWDARTQTEFGTLRAYIQGGWELNTNDANYRGTIFFFRAFIQFAGLTVGKTQSFFAFYSNALNYTTLQGGGESDAGVNLMAYTAQFAGGFSATVSVEDAKHHRAGLHDSTTVGGNPLPIGGIPGGGAPAYGDYAGVEWPDVVANLRVDQPWGSAQIAGAVRQVKGLWAGANNLLNPVTGPDRVGFAVSGGVRFNLPFAQGDQLWIQGTYAKGAAMYLGYNPFVHTGGQFALFSGGLPVNLGGNGRLAVAWALDGVFNQTGSSLTEGWSVLAALRHFWTPSLRSSVFGHYTKLEYGNAGNARMCTTAVGGAGQLQAVQNCNFDFSTMQVGANTIWSPVRNLDIGVEVLYSRIETHLGQVAIGQTGARPAGVYNTGANDTWSATVRFQRNFWP
jgi:hypothetical protein